MNDVQTPHKARAKNTLGSNVGKQRQDLYKNAVLRIKEAIDQGFYLEAIAITESLIADRLESRLSQVLGRNFSHRPLGPLINAIRKEETDLLLIEYVSTDLDNWRNLRNTSMHEMVKLGDGDTRSWQDRMETLEPIARNGFRLFRKINDRVAILREQGTAAAHK